MPGAVVTDDLELLNAGGGPPADRGGSGGGDFHSGPASERERRMYLTGVSVTLAAILMFFMALASSYIVRKGTGTDWQPIDVPPILWLNTAVLVASSITVEVARRKLALGGGIGEFRNWWAITTALGTLFLGGQIVAWRELAEQGLFLATNPSSSFFYLLTASHGAHLLVGLVALLYVALRAGQTGWRRRAIAAEGVAIYWHFLDGLWVFLLLLLNFGR